MRSSGGRGRNRGTQIVEHRGLEPEPTDQLPGNNVTHVHTPKAKFTIKLKRKTSVALTRYTTRNHRHRPQVGLLVGDSHWRGDDACGLYIVSD